MDVLLLISAAVAVVSFVAIFAIALLRRQWLVDQPRALRLAVMGLCALAFASTIALGQRRDSLHEPTLLAQPRDFGHPAPVLVAWRHDDEQLAPYNAVIRQAFADWNGSVGCTVLAEAQAGQAPDARILGITEQPCGDPVAEDLLCAAATGGTWQCPTGPIDVQFRQLDEIAEAFEIIRHELGHVLQLADDPPGLGGPMAAQAVVTFPPPLVREADRRALRARYCR